MVEEKGFNKERVESGINKLVKALKSQTQSTLESFFGKPKIIKKDSKKKIKGKINNLAKNRKRLKK